MSTALLTATQSQITGEVSLDDAKVVSAVGLPAFMDLLREHGAPKGTRVKIKGPWNPSHLIFTV